MSINQPTDDDLRFSIEQVFLSLEAETQDLIKSAVDQAFDLGRKHERERIADALPNLFWSVMRHPAHRQSATKDILSSCARAIRRGLGEF